MAKGLYTQGVVLLTNGTTTVADLAAALHNAGFDLVDERPANEHWAFGGPALLVAYQPDVNGYIVIDVVDVPWPDHMGDPKQEPMIFGAWSMGNFGPQAFPGGLQRACQQSWGWEAGRTVPLTHTGFIRIRLSYVFGGDKDAPLFPESYDPVAELNFLSRMVYAVVGLRGVLCYFNPNGEVVYDAANFRKLWDDCTAAKNLPLPLWMNVRFYNLSATLGLMDTVGSAQLDIQDVEAIFPFDKYDPNVVGYYLRNITHHLLDLDRELRSGEAIDGPRETSLGWTTEALDQGVAAPPRRLVRLYPRAMKKEITKAVATATRGT